MKINDKHLVHFASCGDPIDKEGFLWKKGELNTSYQKRWCVLRGNLFFYYERKYDREPIGVIVLENCFVQLTEGGDSPYTFSIHFTGESTRIYKLTADDDESCTSWIKALSTSSYRYLKILVDGLEKDVESLRAAQLANSHLKDEDTSHPNVTPVPSIGIVRADSNFSGLNPHPAICKSCSLTDVGASEESFIENNANFLKFEAYPPENNISGTSPPLSRSRSSSEIHSLPVNEFLDVRSVSVKKLKSPSYKKKSTVMKKLSPRVGRKKYANPQTVQKELLSMNTKSVKQVTVKQESVKQATVQQESVKQATVSPNRPSLPKQSYNFLEMHEKFRNDIRKLVGDLD